MITLYYIEGISRTDEPVFHGEYGARYQSLFMANHAVCSIDTGFYPPHYHNVIDLSTNDVDFNTQVNYLSLEYGGKTYYYFIDSIQYVSESDIKVIVTMDTIQTYMFDIVNYHAEITKNTIHRFINHDINRNYIRENISNGNFEINKFEKLYNSDVYAVVFKCTALESLFMTWGTNGTEHSYIPNSTILKLFNKSVPSPYGYIVMPFVFDDEVDINYYYLKDGTRYSLDTVQDWSTFVKYIRNIISLPCCEDAFVLPGTTLDQLGIEYEKITTSSGTTIYNFITKHDHSESLAYKYTRGAKFYLKPTETTTKLIAYGYTLGDGAYDSLLIQYDLTPEALESNEPNKPFDWHKVPQMIDENYMQIDFGERAGYTGYPLHLWKEVDMGLTGNFVLNLIDNERLYWIEYPYDNPTIDIKDRYLTLMKVTTKEHFELLTDAYTQYIAQNYATLTMGYSLATANATYQTAKGAANGLTQALLGVAQVSTSPNPLGKLAGTSNVVKGLENTFFGATDGLMDLYNIDKNREISLANAEFAPDTTKQGNTLRSDLLLDTIVPFYRLRVVTDIEDCAMNFESYGYKVHEDTDITSLFEYRHRYYFDVIQATNIIMSIGNYITDEATLNSIKARFESGLRLWHNNISGTTELERSKLLGHLGRTTEFDNFDY